MKERGIRDEVVVQLGKPCCISIRFSFRVQNAFGVVTSLAVRVPAAKNYAIPVEKLTATALLTLSRPREETPLERSLLLPKHSIRRVTRFSFHACRELFGPQSPSRFRAGSYTSQN